MRQLRSLRHRATLFICALILAVVAAYAATAYQQMRSAAFRAASGQLAPVPGAVASALAGLAEEMRQNASTQAADPAVRQYLVSADSARAAAALAALRPGRNERGVTAIELRDAAGTLRLAHGPEREAGLPGLGPELDSLSRVTDSAFVAPMRLTVSGPKIPVIAPVVDGGRRIGSIVRWRTLRGLRVVSTGARVYVVNADGALWTDATRSVEPLDLDPAYFASAQGRVPFNHNGLLLAGAPVPGAPWVVVLAMPHELVAGGPRRAMGRMILIGLMLTLAAALVGWLVSGRLTASVYDLGSAARAISNGDYTRRTSVTGEDEIGMLGRAFNRMADSVQDAHRELEAKVVQLAAGEARMRETRSRMEHVISSSGAILYTYRIGEREIFVDWVSESVERLLGYSVDDARVPGLWRRLRHPDDHDRFRDAQKRLQQEGRVTVEYRLRHADGQYRWVRDQQRLLRDEDGAPREVVGVLSDVSETRRLEGAKEAAEAASRAKSEFLSRMSHELRTPLNSVLGFGQLLQLDVESPENRESVAQILKAGQHLLSLIDEVLDISRIESGQMSLSVEPVQVSETVQEALDLVRLFADEQGIALRVTEAAACDDFVQADQQRLKQVLLNLLSNAIKYNRRNGRVTIRCRAGEGDRLRILVEDTGFGIEAVKMTRLFRPFERLGADRAGVEGTGLGLALSRGLVEAMGGILGVESEPGEGSRFWIELPRAERPEIVEDSPPPGLVPAPPEEADVTHVVLFIEDNLANVRLFERLFQRRPHVRLLTAMQGSLGLQLAREQRPDLILLDLNLPDLPGDVVLRSIRHDPELREIPTVMISGDAIPSQVQRMLELGATDYITKPFDIQHLLTLVDEILGEKSRV